MWIYGSLFPLRSRSSAEFALNHHLRREFLSVEPTLQRVAPLIEEAKLIHVDLDVATLEYALRKRLEEMAEKLLDPRSDPRSIAHFRAAIELARALPFPVNLWQVQNLFYEQLRAPAGKPRAERRTCIFRCVGFSRRACEIRRDSTLHTRGPTARFPFSGGGLDPQGAYLYRDRKRGSRLQAYTTFATKSNLRHHIFVSYRACVRVSSGLD